MRFWIFCLLLTSLHTLGQAPTGQSSGVKAMHDLFTAEWDYDMQQRPEEASSQGDRRWNDRWTNESLEAHAQRNQHNQDVLARLNKIDRNALPPAEQLNYDLFQKRYEDRIEGYRFHWFLLPLNQREGIQTSDDLADALRFETLKDYEDWIARMRAFPVLMDQTIAVMRQGIRERMVHPRVIMQRIPGQIDKQLVTDPAQSPFYKPFQHFSRNISAADQQRLQTEARQAVVQQVVPAFQKFKQFFVSEYLPACYDQVGAAPAFAMLQMQHRCCQPASRISTA